MMSDMELHKVKKKRAQRKEDDLSMSYQAPR